MTPRAMSRAGVLRFGLLAGASVGALAGLADGLGAPSMPWRLVYAAGATGLLGAVAGLLAALLIFTRPSIRQGGVPAVAAAVCSLALFPVVAIALGLLVNRFVLRGTPFQRPVSLLADAVVLAVTGLFALLVARILRRLLRGAAGSQPPSPLETFAALFPLLVASVLPSFLPRRGAADPSRPSIVLVSIDTLRPDHLSAGGDPRGTSPELDRLLREGLQFSEAITVSPGSAASHAGLLTSRVPVSNGVFANFSVMDTSVTTIAEILRDEGYRTGGFVTNTFLGKRFGFDQGFDAYVESGAVERLAETSAAALFRSLALVQIVDRTRVRFSPAYDPSFETALRWIRESRAPTFFFVHLMDVHSPYAPPHPYGPRFGASPKAGKVMAGRRNRFGWRPSEPAYAAEVRFADSKIRRLRHTLEEQGLLDSCVILLTSDHGENMEDHAPNFTHGQTLYESTLRVLAAIRAPQTDLRRGLEPAQLVNTDMLPTLAALVGERPFPDWEGRSFHPAAPADTLPAWSQLNRDFCARRPTWKAILRADHVRELYRLDEDPGETRTITPSAEEVALLEAQLAQWLGEHATRLYLEDASAVAVHDLPPDVVEKLKALGYVE